MTIMIWVTLQGGMPQGTWLGPLSFTILIDDLQPVLLTHRYVDDTTVTEIIEKGSVSEMQNTIATLVEWSYRAREVTVSFRTR